MGNIRRRVAAALLFIDTVTQRVIAGGSLRLEVKQKSPVIWKEEGYAVIMQQQGVDSLDILVSGGGFAPARLHVEAVREAPVQICHVYLLPSETYPFTPQMAVIHGKGLAKTIYALRVADSSKYKLMETVTAGGKMIKLWSAKGLSPGQMLFLEGEDFCEQVMILEADDETEYGYYVSGAIQGSYAKRNTNVYSSIKIMPDESGGFWLAYDGIYKGGEKIILADGSENKMEINNMKIKMEIDIEERQQYTVCFD